MLDLISGLPTHALVVHAVVVLLPLAAVSAVAVALVPALRRRYGELVAVLTAVAVAAVPVATHSGQHLFDRKSATFGPANAAEAALMEGHRNLGHQLWPWAVVLLVGVLLVVGPPLMLGRMRRHSASPASPASPAWARGLALFAAAAVLVGAAGTTIMVYRIGDAGSRAAWSTLVQ
jgi:hypothetical protein